MFDTLTAGLLQVLRGEMWRMSATPAADKKITDNAQAKSCGTRGSYLWIWLLGVPAGFILGVVLILCGLLWIITGTLDQLAVSLEYILSVF